MRCVRNKMFSKILHDSTIENHKRVDRHEFVKKIKTNEIAGEIYIKFNKMCIDRIQRNNNNKYKMINELYIDVEYVENENRMINEDISVILERCKKYPLEHAYMFYLGLLYGGDILKRYIPKYKEFLTFENGKDKIKRFKEMLDEVDSSKWESFTEIVNESYKIIYIIFSKFDKYIENQLMS